MNVAEYDIKIRRGFEFKEMANLSILMNNGTSTPFSFSDYSQYTLSGQVASDQAFSNVLAQFEFIVLDSDSMLYFIGGNSTGTMPLTTSAQSALWFRLSLVHTVDTDNNILMARGRAEVE